jgi:hypothetical protein
MTTVTPKTTVSVSRAKLARALAAVYPHCIHRDEDETGWAEHPAFASVQFEAAGPDLFLIATDRYSIAIARVPVPGGQPGAEPATWLLPWSEVEDLIRWLTGSDGTVAALTLYDGQMNVDVDGPVRHEHFTVREPQWHLPSWRELLGKVWASPPGLLGDTYGLDPALAARFNIDQPGRPGSSDGRAPLHLSARDVEGHSGPVILVTFEDWLIGAAMPVRVAEPAKQGDARAFWTAALTTTTTEEATP